MAIIMIAQNKRLIILLLGVPLFLLIPLISMQFTDQVNWSPLDFLIAGILLLGTGLVVEAILRKVEKMENRLALCLVVLVLTGLIWAEMAVGLFGTPLAGS